MSERPHLAILLLPRLAPGQVALAGDLQEELRGGRSRTWIWRQVLVAIIVAIRRDLRNHTLLTLRALAIGWVAMRCIQTVLGNPLAGFMRGWVLDQLIVRVPDADRFLMLWATDLSAYPSIILIGLSTGWLVGRSHRGHVAGVLTSAVVVGGFSLYRAVFAALIPHPMMPGYVNLPAPMFTVVSRTLLLPLFIVLGGVWGMLQGRELGLT